jgi:predicted 3-demethylubiquinone-9 3-methyltransferase (glyoxalase superfamily)
MNQLIMLGTMLIALANACTYTDNSKNNTKPKSAENDLNKTNKNMITQKITPSLWVETTNAKEVVDYYLSIFKDAKLKEHHQYKNPPEAGGGNFETAVMELNGLEFSILAAGPYFKFNESVSFVINCVDQAEVDYYWNALTANGGQESACGWCKDKYGLSWQVVPVEYFELINSPNQAVREKAIKNTLTQKKLILSELK